MYSTIYSKCSIFHSIRNEKTQDVISIKSNLQSDNNYIAMALADGISESAFSRKAGEKLTDFLASFLYDHYESMICEIYQTAISDICAKVTEILDDMAESYSVDTSHFGSTLCGAVTDGKKLFYFSCGDSIIFAINAEKQVCIVAEHCGAISAYTHCFTESDIKYGVVSADEFSALYLASDGFVSVIFEHGTESVKAEVKDFIINNNTKTLNEYLDNKLLMDDCSYCCAILK